jgi:hypothetical protein
MRLLLRASAVFVLLVFVPRFCTAKTGLPGCAVRLTCPIVRMDLQHTDMLFSCHVMSPHLALNHSAFLPTTTAPAEAGRRLLHLMFALLERVLLKNGSVRKAT